MAIPSITTLTSSTPNDPVHMAFAVPSIITEIFKNLSGLELAAVQTVCHSWVKHTLDTDVLFLKKKRAEAWHEFHKVCGRIESFEDPKCTGIAKYIRLNTSDSLQKERNLKKQLLIIAKFWAFIGGEKAKNNTRFALQTWILTLKLAQVVSLKELKKLVIKTSDKIKPFDITSDKLVKPLDITSYKLVKAYNFL